MDYMNCCRLKMRLDFGLSFFSETCGNTIIHHMKFKIYCCPVLYLYMTVWRERMVHFVNWALYTICPNSSLKKKNYFFLTFSWYGLYTITTLITWDLFCLLNPSSQPDLFVNTVSHLVNKNIPHEVNRWQIIFGSQSRCWKFHAKKKSNTCCCNFHPKI